MTQLAPSLRPLPNGELQLFVWDRIIVPKQRRFEGIILTFISINGMTVLVRLGKPTLPAIKERRIARERRRGRARGRTFHDPSLVQW